jgi:hypothetical protein
MEARMLYPHVTEIARAGHAAHPFPRTQRELVALSLLANPAKTVRPMLDRDHPRGIFR